jgi:hypothetical protein
MLDSEVSDRLGKENTLNDDCISPFSRHARERFINLVRCLDRVTLDGDLRPRPWKSETVLDCKSKLVEGLSCLSRVPRRASIA